MSNAGSARGQPVTRAATVSGAGVLHDARRVLDRRRPVRGHLLLVLPGFGGGDASTRPLRHTLDRLGYGPHRWGQGIKASGRGVSLIGWRLGGLDAVAVARGALDACER